MKKQSFAVMSRNGRKKDVEIFFSVENWTNCRHCLKSIVWGHTKSHARQVPIESRVIDAAEGRSLEEIWVYEYKPHKCANMAHYWNF